MEREKAVSEALEKIRDEFYPDEILTAATAFEETMYTLVDKEIYPPPEVWDKLMDLHKMTKKLIEDEYAGEKELDQLLELANDIDLVICECLRELEKINDMTSKLLDLGHYQEHGR